VNIRHERGPGHGENTLKTLTLNEVAPVDARARAIVPSFVGAVRPTAPRQRPQARY
jgi:hypothetical protein